MTIQQLEYFVAIAHTLSFSKAAESFYISQSTLSRSMSALEKEFGCSLFLRTTRMVQLTHAGETLLQEAEKIIRRCNELEKKMKYERQFNQKQLQIGYFMIGALYDIQKKIPELEMDYLLNTEGETLEHLIQRFNQGEFDFVLIPESLASSFFELEYIRYKRTQYQLIVHKSHSLAQRDEIDAQELSDISFIALDEQRSPNANRALRNICMKNGFSPNIVGTSMKANDAAMKAKQYNAAVLVSDYVARAIPTDFRRLSVRNVKFESWVVIGWHAGEHAGIVDEVVEKIKRDIA